MAQIVYAMQFKGQAAPVNDAGTVLRAKTASPSCSITTVVGPDGVTGGAEAAAGEQANFESEVAFSDQSTFQETGTIAFGGGHQLAFSTVGQGHLEESAEPGLMHGSVIWKIDSGTGQFEGATGLITSNFTVNAAGEVTDNQFGVIFVK